MELEQSRSKTTIILLLFKHLYGGFSLGLRVCDMLNCVFCAVSHGLLHVELIIFFVEPLLEYY